MEMSMKMKMIVGMLMMWMVVGEAALNCGTVDSKLAPCIKYLQSPTADNFAACCNGIRSLNSLASTTPDRQVACGCLKSAARSLPATAINAAAGLPAKCGVNIGFPISPNTDCSKIN